MNQEQIAIDLIVGIAAKFEAALLNRMSTEALFEVIVRRADSKQAVYRIRVHATGNEISAREEGTKNLPDFCPDRHINGDGSFCLYWHEEFSIHVTNVDAASKWWESLQGFLRLQERAAYAREWTGDGWAHGDAARYQYDALQAAEKLGNSFVVAIRSKHLAIEKIKSKNPANGMTLHLLLNGRPICRVRQNMSRVTGQYSFRKFRIRGTKKVARKLRFHEIRPSAYVKLVSALWSWDVMENAYWNECSTGKCCGTLDTCRLRRVEDKKENALV
jgi:hypothetical protein